MRYEIRKGLLIPVESPVDIIVFIDETYLLDRTGFLQAAVTVPSDVYSNQLHPLCSDLLRQLGVDAKEFKGTGIKNGNKRIYIQFLRYFTNVVAELGDRTELRPIVTVDATEPYGGENFRWIFENVLGGLKNLGIENEDYLVAAFSKQILWLFNHWKKISSVEYSNSVVLTFDNQYEYAQKFLERRGVINKQLIAPAFWELGKLMTSIANTLFSQMEPRIPIPRIGRFAFQHSISEFGLQAADLFSNLFHNALKHEKGIRDANIDMKYELLMEVMPEFKLNPLLEAALEVATDGQNRAALRCRDPNLLSTFQLQPVAP